MALAAKELAPVPIVLPREHRDPRSIILADLQKLGERFAPDTVHEFVKGNDAAAIEGSVALTRMSRRLGLREFLIVASPQAREEIHAFVYSEPRNERGEEVVGAWKAGGLEFIGAWTIEGKERYLRELSEKKNKAPRLTILQKDVSINV